MPIYEYKCNACGKEFEYQQRMSDPEKTDCEACGKPALERLISRTAFTLKGGGWYKDLYSSSKPGSDTKADGGGSSSKSDSAPAKPSESSSSSASSDSGSTGSSTPSSSTSSTPSSGGSSSGSGSSGSGGSKAAASAS